MLSRSQVFIELINEHTVQQGAINFGSRPNRGDIDHVAEELKEKAATMYAEDD